MSADSIEKTFTADPNKWINYEGYDVQVSNGSVTLNLESGVARCGVHHLKLLFNAITGARTCPNCGTEALIQLASIA